MSDQPERYERHRKPKSCPRCGHQPVAEIVYGEPCSYDLIRSAIDREEIVLFGCHIPDDAPAWFCYGCDAVVHQRFNLLDRLVRYCDCLVDRVRQRFE